MEFQTIRVGHPPRVSADFVLKVLMGMSALRTSPTVSATLPVARTPQSHYPPVRRRQRRPRPKRESLGEVIVVVESGYTQQKVQLRQRAQRQAVKGSGFGW